LYFHILHVHAIPTLESTDSKIHFRNLLRFTQSNWDCLNAPKHTCTPHTCTHLHKLQHTTHTHTHTWYSTHPPTHTHTHPIVCMSDDSSPLLSEGDISVATSASINSTFFAKVANWGKVF